MIYKLVLWLMKFVSDNEKKAIVLMLLQDTVQSKTNSIDPGFAELVMRQVVKSRGNKVAAYIVKE